MISRRKPPDSRIERKIIKGMIMNDQFLKEVKNLQREEGEGLALPFTRKVADWCFEYLDAYGQSPKRHIEDIFRVKKESELQEEDAELIAEFLADLSKEYAREEAFNVDFLLDEAEKHFRLVSLQALKSKMSTLITSGSIDECEGVIRGYERPTRQQSVGIDPILDANAILLAFEKIQSGGIFRFPGDLGRLVGPLDRGHLFAIVGGAKAGKSWWLMMMGLVAAFAGYNVLFVSLEMLLEQMTERIQTWVNAATTKQEYAGNLLIPVFDCLHNQKGECEMNESCGVTLLDKNGELPDFNYSPNGYRTCVACRGSRDFSPGTWYKKGHRDLLTYERAIRKRNAIERSNILRGRFKLLQFPSGTITTDELDIHINNLSYYDGFDADIIITDYADKFRRREREYRHGIGDIWEAHKAWAQAKRALVVTASQPSGEVIRQGRDIRKGDWAEDIRKLNLIDAAMAINSTEEEKEKGYSRAYVMAHRHREFSVLNEVLVLSQLKIGRPYLDSCQIS